MAHRNLPDRAAMLDVDGKEVAPATPATVTVHWITKDDELEAKGWDDLAAKLKATGFKKTGSPAFRKIRVLNFLGGDGWELMDQGGNPALVATGPNFSGAAPGGRGGLRAVASSTWLFKRRVP